MTKTNVRAWSARSVRGIMGALGALLLFAAPGCAVDEGAACSIDGDCAAGLVCNMYSKICSQPEDVCEEDFHCQDPAKPTCGPDHLCVALVTGADAGADTVAPQDTGGGEDVAAPEDIKVPDISPDVLEPPCPEPAGTMLRATLFAISGAAEPGAGMDVDDDAETCAPEGKCSGGVDNALAGLAPVANAPAITPAVQNHELNLLFVPEPPAPEDDCFALLTRFAAATEAGTDEWTYAITPGDATPPCAEGASFLDACLSGDTVSAGFAVDATFPLRIPLFGSDLEVPVHEARLRATVTRAEDGTFSGMTGLVAGAVDVAEFDALLATVEVEGVDVVNMVHRLVTPDLDRDGDGTDDAFSVALEIEAAPVTVTGFEGDGG